jgi:hypothetical protein
MVFIVFFLNRSNSKHAEFTGIHILCLCSYTVEPPRPNINHHTQGMDYTEATSTLGNTENDTGTDF